MDRMHLSSILTFMENDQIGILLRKIEDMNVRLDLIESTLDLNRELYRHKNRSSRGHVKLRSFVGALIRRNQFLTKFLLELRYKRR
jgi:hypothetical protein